MQQSWNEAANESAGGRRSSSVCSVSSSLPSFLHLISAAPGPFISFVEGLSHRHGDHGGARGHAAERPASVSDTTVEQTRNNSSREDFAFRCTERLCLHYTAVRQMFNSIMSESSVCALVRNALPQRRCRPSSEQAVIFRLVKDRVSLWLVAAGQGGC